MENKKLVDALNDNGVLAREEFIQLIMSFNDNDLSYVQALARSISQKYFGNRIYTRGLIEISSYCKNDCYYCGLRRGNKNAQRYRLSKDDILSCCEQGYTLGFRTFVLQGGEDNYYSDEIITDIISSIKKKYSDCAVTLSLGEKNKSTYQKYFQAGADRYLLRHETADETHYGKLHPENMSLSNRKQCLYNLKEIGFQTGCGIMVGSPYQTAENIADDMLFMKELQPHMVGIGPFIPHKDTPFRDMPAGSFRLTLFLLSLIRIMLKNVLLPATTALGTINKNGREQGILSGANVVMPNLSPISVRKKYMLYDNKICTGEESAECKACLENRIKSIGYQLVTDRGDYK
jgi:biotin synthase